MSKLICALFFPAILILMGTLGSYGQSQDGSNVNQPFKCGDILTDNRDNQPYKTMTAGPFCLMRENLNIGKMVIEVNGRHRQLDNGIIEKFCYDDKEKNCRKYGGLYQWQEAMQHVVTQGTQGICPDGWHLPNNKEMNIIFRSIASQLNLSSSYKDIRRHARDTSAFIRGTTPDLFTEQGFPVQTGGLYDYQYNTFTGEEQTGTYWSSSQANQVTAWSRIIDYPSSNMERSKDDKNNGYSIRCISPCMPQPGDASAGNNQIVYPGTTTILMANQPSEGKGSWSVINGAGGVIAESTNHASEFRGLQDTQYTLMWTISTVCGKSEDVVIIFFASTAGCADILTDPRDGQEYPTILIGSQCWMAENLNIGKYKASPGGGGPFQTNDGIIEKFCYADNPINCDLLGGLYEWDEVMQYSLNEGAKGICPDGWHIPSRVDFGQLTTFLGGADVAGGKMKATLPVSWNAPNAGATNESGFSGLPGGIIISDGGVFYDKGKKGYFWSSSGHEEIESNINEKFQLQLHNDSPIANLGYWYKDLGYSIRCIKDCLMPATQSDAGSNQLVHPGNNTTLDGNTPEIGWGEWEIINGNGGTIGDPMDPETNFTGLTGKVYSLSWTIRTLCDTSSDIVIIRFADSFNCGDALADERDGQFYNTAAIGDQCWMAGNMNIGKKVRNACCGYLHHENAIIEKYCYDCDKYGGLYEWGEAMQYATLEGARGICPEGWHIPTDDEWKILEGVVDSQHPAGDPVWDNTGQRGTDAGGKLKAEGTALWSTPNVGATDEYGFRAFPGAYRYLEGVFKGTDGNKAYYWTSSAEGQENAWNRTFNYDNSLVTRGATYKVSGLSVRCIKND